MDVHVYVGGGWVFVCACVRTCACLFGCVFMYTYMLILVTFPTPSLPDIEPCGLNIKPPPY